MLLRRALIIFAVIFAWVLPVRGQIISRDDSIARFDADSLRRAFDSGPYFSFYKDNYFIVGTSLGYKPTAYNSNVKFQISIQQKLTKSTLPWNTYIYLFYTQKCFWDVFRNSMPMTDLNFNPGIGVAKPFFSTVTGRYVGKAFLVLEHESNGRDGEASRSWNKISFGGNIYVDKNLMVSAKFWIPIVDGGYNRDILRYSGIYQMSVDYMTDNRRFGASLLLVKRKDWNPFNFNTQLDIKFRVFPKDNQYLFLQYYNGYGEGLLAYKEFHTQIRVGICLSPTFFGEY
ncbi:MAG: phospholipase A [Muribaculaceae bacterium]|nr:phospholipase A [Muribaculaceae bacterium]MDE6229791.1 phospholipase A [Muribaculaceae bacterium]